MGVMHVGSPCCGMNAAVMAYVRQCICRHDVVKGIHDGFEGLLNGDVSYQKIS